MGRKVSLTTLLFPKEHPKSFGKVVPWTGGGEFPHGRQLVQIRAVTRSDQVQTLMQSAIQAGRDPVIRQAGVSTAALNVLASLSSAAS